MQQFAASKLTWIRSSKLSCNVLPSVVIRYIWYDMTTFWDFLYLGNFRNRYVAELKRNIHKTDSQKENIAGQKFHNQINLVILVIPESRIQNLDNPELDMVIRINPVDSDST